MLQLFLNQDLVVDVWLVQHDGTMADPDILTWSETYRASEAKILLDADRTYLPLG